MMNWTRSSAFFMAATCGAFACAWQDDSPDTAETVAVRQDGDLSIRVGFSDMWKLGHTCPIRIDVPESLIGQVAELKVVTVDGDGVDVVYTRKTTELEQREADRLWFSVRAGRSQQPVAVELYDDQSELLITGQASQETQVLDSAQPFVIALGSAMGVADLSRTNTTGDSQSFSTAELSDPQELSPSWRSFAGCDVVVLSCANVEFLKGITEDQWNALDTWVRRGGGCIISLSGRADTELNDLSGLRRLLPGDITSAGEIGDPGLLESLVSTEEPLRSFSATRVDIDRGEAELTLTDSLSKDLPWWVTYSHGHGTIRLIASDLGGEAFERWPDRESLWERLLSDYFDRGVLEETTSEKQASDSSYLGYSDLVGQLRATLDVFSGVRVVSFGQVAVILIGVLLLIGPLDYFVSVKWLKRPDVSWWFAGVLLSIVSVSLVYLYRQIRPDEARVNTAQIVDIDVETGDVQGTLWSHVYSGNAHRYDVQAVSQQGGPVYLDWQGLPGRGLGGLLSQLNTNRGIPKYEIEFDSLGQSKLLASGISAGGTKCLVGSWTDAVEISVQSSLSEIPGVDQIAGELVNPLSVDIRDAMLFYHNWFYRLNSRIPPGSAFSISMDTIPKDLARRLNGRKSLDGTDSITRWNPADRNSIDRLLELMMFHKAASGKTYTSLSHRYQPNVDHSNLLDTDRAILIGWLDEPWVSVQVDPLDGQEIPIAQDVDRTWCRLAIPVSKPKSNR